eukprot:6731408-Prymnesium_polylepis.1
MAVSVEPKADQAQELATGERRVVSDAVFEAKGSAAVRDAGAHAGISPSEAESAGAPLQGQQQQQQQQQPRMGTGI